MATTLTTNNPRGLGYQDGFFSGTPGTPINQDWFDSAFAGRINTNKIYKETYQCDIIGECTISTWLDQYTGYETDCNPEYTLLEKSGIRQQIRVAITVTIPAYPATGNITLSTGDHFVSGQYVLPQVGNTIVLAPNGAFATVTAVTHATANDTVITVRQRAGTSGTAVQTVGNELLVLSGSEIADCACPTGQFAVRDVPYEHDLAMIQFGDLGSLCGDALNKCQFLKIPFTDENGNVIEKWYTEAIRDMYRRFEDRKYFEDLLNPTFGIIPVLKARGLKFTPASASEITTDDIREWKQLLDAAGIGNREFAIFAGNEIYSQFQRMLLAAGVTQLQYSERPMADCAWINLQYCGIKVEGMTLHIYDECTFSNGKKLGGLGTVYQNSAIWVPMGNNPAPSQTTSSTLRTGGGDQKMFTKVYFRSLDGRVWDALTDSNGVLGQRNTFGTGCETQEWSVKTRFTNEIHCAQQWGYMGL